MMHECTTPQEGDRKRLCHRVELWRSRIEQPGRCAESQQNSKTPSESEESWELVNLEQGPDAPLPSIEQHTPLNDREHKATSRVEKLIQAQNQELQGIKQVRDSKLREAGWYLTEAEEGGHIERHEHRMKSLNDVVQKMQAAVDFAPLAGKSVQRKLWIAWKDASTTLLCHGGKVKPAIPDVPRFPNQGENLRQSLTASCNSDELARSISKA